MNRTSVKLTAVMSKCCATKALTMEESWSKKVIPEITNQKNIYKKNRREVRRFI
jgi:hypothetical protein